MTLDNVLLELLFRLSQSAFGEMASLDLDYNPMAGSA